MRADENAKSCKNCIHYEYNCDDCNYTTINPEEPSMWMQKLTPAQQYAPELLEALKNICYRVNDTWSDCPHSVRNYATEGLKIIAKAEGRE